MKTLIVGSGLGGLACAIACAQEGLDVVVLERTPELLPVGAGIQIPPNAARVHRHLGTLPRLLQTGVIIEAIEYRRYEDGKLLVARPAADLDESLYGVPWLVIHRADYVKVLQDAAMLAGAKIRLGAEVVDINFDETSVKLSTGEVIRGDAIIGADGLWSGTRDLILSSPSPPTETGDLAYRGTFTGAQLEPLGDPKVNDLCAERKVTVWMGPNRHAVFYPVKRGQQYNLVLLRPDDLPTDTRSKEGEVDEMRDTFQGWDERLQKLISCLPSALKWKLCHHKELETWIKGRVVLLGDACHPSLPYQAQGAAMAVEDGAVLGKLLGKASELGGANMESFVPKVLRLYESLRKSRTTVNVVGAVANRYWYHLPDGPEQEERDAFLRKEIWSNKVNWNLLDADYQYNLLGVDVVKDCEEAFEVWVRSCGS